MGNLRQRQSKAAAAAVVLIFLMGAVVGAATASVWWLDTVKASTNVQSDMLADIEDNRAVGGRCVEVLEQLWAKIEAGKRSEHARDAAP